jgi:hypothetical protein
LPVARPDDAPPRETAEEKAKREAAETTQPKPEAPAPPLRQRKQLNKKGAGSTGAFR